MIKIRISYDRQQEAERLLQILSPAIKGAKVQKSENGQHKKIYITIGLFEMKRFRCTQKRVQCVHTKKGAKGAHKANVKANADRTFRSGRLRQMSGIGTLTNTYILCGLEAKIS